MSSTIDKEILQDLLAKIEFFKSSNDPHSLSSTYLALAKIYKQNENFSDVKLYLNMAIETLEANPDIDPSIHYNVYNLTADLFLKRHALIRAESYYKKALYFAQEKDKGTILSKLTHVNIRRRDWNGALNYADQAKKEFSIHQDIKALGTVLRFIITIYAKKQESDLALKIFDELNKISGGIERYNFELGRLYHLLKDYKHALEHYELAETLEIQKVKLIEVKIYMARVYLKLGDNSKAMHYLNDSFKEKDLLNDSIELLYLYENFTIYYMATHQVEKATEFHKQTMNLYGKYGNFTNISNFYFDLKEFNPKMTLELAIDHPFGLLWIKETEIDNQSTVIDPNLWKLIIRGTGKFWDYYTSNREIDIFDHWKFRQLMENIRSTITTERVLNLILGPNDLNCKDLRNEEENLSPLWFVELPTFLDHGIRHLKLRLNNIVHRNGEFIGYPIFEQENLFYGKTIERMKVVIKTAWFDEFILDHIFVPNTQAEYEIDKIMIGNVWLKDIYRLDLHDHCQKEDFINIDCHFELYFDSKMSKPDIKTTTKEYIIPIYRRNRLQKLEKFKKKNEHALAIFIALVSLVGTSYGILTGFFYPVLLEQHLPFWDSFILYLYFGFIIVIFLGFLGLLCFLILKVEINKDPRKKKIQEDLDLRNL